MASDDKSDGPSVVDLNLVACTVEDAAVSRADGITKYTLRFGPVSDDMLATLDEGTRAHARVRLVFDREATVVELVSVERSGETSILLTGQIVEMTTLVRKP